MKTATVHTANESSSSTWPAMLEAAASEVFEIMLGAHPPRFEGPAVSHDLTAIVGLAGKLRGALTLRCTHKAASLVTCRMLGAVLDEIRPQSKEHTWDAMGEMCNMIAGNFKNKLPGLADTCLLSVPTVIVGRDYNLLPRANCRTLEMVFEFAGDPFTVTLDIHS